MAEIQAQIAADRRKLAGQKDMEVEEKRKVEEDLEEKEAELAAAQSVIRILSHTLYHCLVQFVEKCWIAPK